MNDASNAAILAYYMNTRTALSFSLNYSISENYFSVDAIGLSIDLRTGALADKEENYPLEEREYIYRNFLNEPSRFGNYIDAKKHFDLLVTESMKELTAFPDASIAERGKAGNVLKPYWNYSNETYTIF